MVFIRKKSNIEKYNEKRGIKRKMDEALSESRRERMNAINLKRRSKRDARISAEHATTYVLDKASHGLYTGSKAGKAGGSALLNLIRSGRSKTKSGMAARKFEKLKRRYNRVKL